MKGELSSILRRKIMQEKFLLQNLNPNDGCNSIILDRKSLKSKTFILFRKCLFNPLKSFRDVKRYKFGV